MDKELLVQELVIIFNLGLCEAAGNCGTERLTQEDS
jgi:hypothetical protein